MIMEYWIARDLDDKLYLYTHEPIRRTDVFERSVGIMYQIDDHLVSEATWENSPRKIKIELV